MKPGENGMTQILKQRSRHKPKPKPTVEYRAQKKKETLMTTKFFRLL